MSPRTVIVLNDYCYIQGGASRVAVDEAVALSESGLDVIFLGACGPICPELQQAHLRVVCLNQPELVSVGKNPGVALQGLWNLPAYRAMKEILAPLDPATTVVHLHGYTKSLTTSPVRAAVKAGFRVVCTLHDFFAACPNGGFFDYAKGHFCPKRALSLDCISTNCDKRSYAQKLYRVARSVMQRMAGELPRGVMDYITLSKRSVEILRSYLPPEARYYPLENITELAQTPAVDVAANQSLVYVGRLDPEKGIEVLVEAVRRSGVSLVMVGDGPLRHLADGMPNVRITGWLSPEQVFAQLASARALVFPSLWYETYGLVVSEAAARGVPAIVSEISAASERVTHGVDGWQVRTGDAEDLARALAHTQDDAAIRAAGQAAYDKFWAAPPTRDAHNRGLIDIYHRVLAAPPKRNAS